MRTARNIAIVLVLALIVDVVPGGGNVAQGIGAAVSLLFFALITFGGYQLFRQNRLAYLGLTERQRALFVGSLGAIVLMIAGSDELTSSGGGLLLWLAVLIFSGFAIFKVWTEVQSRY